MPVQIQVPQMQKILERVRMHAHLLPAAQFVALSLPPPRCAVRGRADHHHQPGVLSARDALRTPLQGNLPAVLLPEQMWPDLSALRSQAMSYGNYRHREIQVDLAVWLPS